MYYLWLERFKKIRNTDYSNPNTRATRLNARVIVSNV
tara:strand:- start:1608 stop:1718 length:111 start_codon:yes stop_codon:yes gene_type:complete